MRSGFFSKKRIILASSVLFLVFIFAIIINTNHETVVSNPNDTEISTPMDELKNGLLSGLNCDNSDKRPLAVMYSSDTEARPLLGIDSADFVIEMPVTESGVTRMMALFQCNEPTEYGPIRSARMDFIPYVKGFGAYYVHWGGEHEALQLLDSGVVDNIDCMKFDGSTCYRKSTRLRPNNGFSSLKLIADKIDQFKYPDKVKELGYIFNDKASSNDEKVPPVFYLGEFAVKWTYDKKTNKYSRFRNGTVELDQLSQVQVQASNVIALKTTSKYVSILYNRVKTVGSGNATVYQNGEIIQAKWEKPSETAGLVFKDLEGKEISLNKGKTWVEIVTN